VIKWFAELNLPVCDDGDLIKQNFEAKRRYYVSKLNDPNRAVREPAVEAVKHAAALTNPKERAELLEIVYQAFVGKVRVLVADKCASGAKKVTQPLLASLKDLGMDQCRLREDLAGRFVERFVNEQGWKPDGPIVTPSRVDNFTAKSELGKITLSWVFPATNCDLVELYRDADKKKPVYSGKDGAFADDDAAPGFHTYRIHAVYQGVPGPESLAKAWRLAEVRGPQGSWKAGKVNLSWSLPCQDVLVHVFRRDGARPAFRVTAQGIEPAEPQTRPVPLNANTSLAEVAPGEGITWHYLVVLEFGSGLFTEGVDIPVHVPRPPPPVPSVTAVYTPAHDKDAVEVKWVAVSGSGPMEYVVVRRLGSAAPAELIEKEVVKKTAATSCLDDTVVAGRRYTYAVFTRSGELHSRQGTAAPPVDILADVIGLEPKAGDHTVELEWKTPPNARDVIVRRGLVPPTGPTDGKEIKADLALGRAKDADLQNGKTYHYVVYCVYCPDAQTKKLSKGARAQATPGEMPQLAEEFKAVPQGREIICTWRPPAQGAPLVIRSAKPHALPKGSRLSTRELNQLMSELSGGTILVDASGDQAVDRSPELAKPCYSLFTVAGQHAVVCGTCECAAVQDVTGLSLAEATSEGVLLSWNWPPQCEVVRVGHRADDWPESHDDPKAAWEIVTHEKYRQAGDKHLLRVNSPQGRLFCRVYAQVYGGARRFFSPGKEPTCQKEIQWLPAMSLSYKLAVGRDLLRRRVLALDWSVQNPSPGFTGFALVANRDHVPASLGDGTAVFEAKSQAHARPGKHHEDIPWAKVAGKVGEFFYCKLFLLKPEPSIYLYHPDTSEPLSASR
jgi:hypothetical protein